MDWTLTWLTVQAIATCVLAVGIGVTIWQVIVTKGSAKRNARAQLTIEFFWKSRGTDIVDKLRSIYKLEPRDFRKWSGKTRHEIDYVINWLDTLGFLVKEELVDEQLSEEVFAGVTTLRCWYKLVHYITNERDDRGVYAENFEGLARLTFDHFESAGIPAKLFGINLLLKLQKKNMIPRSFNEIKNSRTK